MPGSECNLIQTAFIRQKRDAELRSVRAKLPIEQRTAFDKLLNALLAYLTAHDQNETAVMGHWRFNGWEGISGESEDTFLLSSATFEKGALPHATSAEYSEADKALNQTYVEVMAVAERNQAGGRIERQIGDPPTRASIRATERLWLAYRDAFAEFGTLRYPKTTRDAWLSLGDHSMGRQVLLNQEHQSGRQHTRNVSFQFSADPDL